MPEYPCPKKLHAKIHTVLSDLDTLPFVYRKLIKLLNSNYVSSRELGTVISLDPSLSIRVLRMVNSAYYGLTQKVLSVAQAVNLLGLNVVRSLCFCLASYDTFFSANSEVESKEWARAMRCGLIAKHLSRSLSIGKPEELFIAGVLHDVGYSILKKYAPKEYKLLRIGLKGRTDEEAERQLIGTTHSEIGALACQAWRLPDLLVECVRCHHNPMACTTYPKAAALICLAAICSSIPSLDGVEFHPESQEAILLAELELAKSDLEQATQAADQEQTVLEEFLEVHH